MAAGILSLVLGTRFIDAQTPERRPLSADDLRHVRPADAGPVVKTRTLLLVTTTENGAQDDSVVAALARDGIAIRHLLGDGVMLAEVPEGADLSEMQTRIRGKKAGRLRGLFRAEEVANARGLATGRNRRAIEAAAQAVGLIAEQRAHPQPLDLLKIEGHAAPSTGEESPRGADGSEFVRSFQRAHGPSALETPLWFDRRAKSRTRDIERSATTTSMSNMISYEPKFAFDKVAIGIRFDAGLSASLHATYIARTVAGMDAFQASNPDAAITTAYAAEVGNVELPIPYTDPGSAEWQWATQLRVQNQARWSFLVLWDDDNDADGCDAGTTCTTADYKVTNDVSPFPSACMFFDACWDAPSLLAKIRPGEQAGTVAHEIGHIFGAGDEYQGSNCSCDGDWGIWRVDNSGCYKCNSDACLMKSALLGSGQGGAGFDYDAPTRTQWGWNDHDGDRAFLVLDPMYSYTMPIDRVQPGDLVVINHVGGTIARRIAVTERNSAPCPWGNSTCTGQYVLWEGFSEEHQAGQYSSGLFIVQIYRNGTMVYESSRTIDPTTTYNDITNISAPPGLVSFQFRKRRISDNVEVGGASYLLARVVRTSDNVEVHRFINHDFSPTGSYSFSTGTLPRGVYSARLLAWTPGNPNHSVDVPFRTLPSIAVDGPTTVGTSGTYTWTANTSRCIGTCDQVQIWRLLPGQSAYTLVSASGGSYSVTFASNQATSVDLKAVVIDANTDGIADTREYYLSVPVNTYPFTASISGPTTIAPNSNYTWSAATTGGAPSLGYAWERRYGEPNPGSWEGVGGESQWVGGSFMGACTPFDLRLTMTDAIGRQLVSSLHVAVQNSGGGLGGACLEDGSLMSAGEAVPTHFELTQDVNAPAISAAMTSAGLRRLTAAPGPSMAVRGSLDATGAATGAPGRLARTGIMAVNFAVPRPGPVASGRGTGVRANAVAGEASGGGSVVQLRIFDTQGRLVRGAVDEILQPGYYNYVWDGRSTGGQKLVPGVYIAVLSAPGATKRTKLIMVQ